MEVGSTMKVSTYKALSQTALALLAGAALGVYPTWRYGQTAALMSELVAGVIVLAVASASMILVLREAKNGPGKMALAFVYSGMGKAIAGAALIFLAWYSLNLTQVVFVWFGVFYLIALASQSIWIMKVLRK